MHGGNMMGPYEKVAAKENERQMSEIFLTSSELTDYVRSVIQLMELINFLPRGGRFITYAVVPRVPGYNLPLETWSSEIFLV